MSTEDFQVQNIHRYTRKTLKKNRHDDTETYYCHHENPNVEVVSTSTSPQIGSDVPGPGCGCSTHPDPELANILHKKCAVISLAQTQMHRLLNGTDILISDDSTRSLYDFLCKLKEILVEHDVTLLWVIFTLVVGFLIGLVLGGASCGTYLGRFDSPILTCIDNMFVSTTFSKVEETLRCIA